MSRNRPLGSPYQTERVSDDFTTDFGVDAYLIDAVALVVTLDPNAVNHDQVEIQDLTLEAATAPIIINASEGQTINGYGSSFVLDVDGGSVQFTFRDGDWIPLLSATGGAGVRGVTGTTGPNGVPGIGSVGATGASGAPGASGATGIGTTGATGVGSTGATGPGGGATGATGATGVSPTGATGAAGTAGTMGATGAPGIVSSAWTSGAQFMSTAFGTLIGGPISVAVAAGQKVILMGAVNGIESPSSGEVILLVDGSPVSQNNFGSNQEVADSTVFVQNEWPGPVTSIDLQGMVASGTASCRSSLQYIVVSE